MGTTNLGNKLTHMGQETALFLVTISLKAVALLPLNLLYGLSDITYYLVHYVGHYRRQVVRKNLQQAYPQLTFQEILSLERKFYRHFCDYLFETIKLLHISDRQMKHRLQFVNIELIEQLRTDGQPFFVYLGHYGNWEYITSITLWCQPGLSACQIYHPLSNKVMDRFFLKLRARFHSVGIPQKQTLRTLLTMKSKGEQALLGLIADQRPPRRHAEYWMTFLNQDTPVITGSEAIGQRLGAHFIYGDMEVTGRGQYRVTLQEMFPVEGEVHSITRQYMERLEATINRAPEYWLWSHKRWKFHHEDFGQQTTDETNQKK